MNLFNYSVVSSPPSFKECQIALLEWINDPSQDQPIIKLSSAELLFQQVHDSLRFLIPCSSTIPVLVPYEFIAHLLKVLQDYFTPPISRLKIEKHYSTIVLLLNEMIEDGLPFVTEENTLRDLVPYNDSFSKYLPTLPKGAAKSLKGISSSLAKNHSSFSNTSTSILSSISSANVPRANVPWRMVDVKHSHNELYVDVQETLSVIIPAVSPAAAFLDRINGTSISVASSSAFYTPSAVSQILAEPLVSIAYGSVYVNSKLTGVPDIQLVLSFGAHRNLDTPAFHPCVRLARWKERPGVLSFIPPDGRCLLMQYTIPEVEAGPVGGDLKTGLGVLKDEFEVRVWTRVPKGVKHVENVRVEVIFDGERAQGVKGTRASSGEFHVEKRGMGMWRFPGKTPIGWSASLRGTLVVDEDVEPGSDGLVLQEFPKYIRISYECNGLLASGTRVESFKIVSAKGLSDNVKPYKGVKYMTKSTDIVIRG